MGNDHYKDPLSFTVRQLKVPMQVATSAHSPTFFFIIGVFLLVLDLLVLEHFSGGGVAKTESLPFDILCEGFAMLRACVDGFSKCEGVFVTTTLDDRIKDYYPLFNTKSVELLKGGLLQNFLDRVISDFDACLVIAPESDGILENYSSIVAHKAVLLAPSPFAVNFASNKLKVNGLTEKLGIKIPPTVVVNRNDDFDKALNPIKALGTPLVVKPVDGCGCEGLSFIKNFNTEIIKKAVEKAFNSSKKIRSEIIVQKWIEGVPASVSLISNGLSSIPLCLNYQNIDISEDPFLVSYSGGHCPLIHEKKKEAFKISQKLLSKISGIRGYVGIDIVLTGEDVFLIEVNPRITTSFLGLYALLGPKLTQIILDTVLKQETPKIPPIKSFAIFKKVLFHDPKVENKHVIQTDPRKGIITPLFPLKDKTYQAFIITTGKTLKEAEDSLKTLL